MSIQYYISFLLLFLILSCTTSRYQPIEINAKRIPVEETIAPDTAIQNFIKPYSVHIDKTLDSVLAYNPTNLSKTDGKLNTAIGNLLADIVMEQANPVFKSRTGKEIDLVLLNHGGIRSTIGIGPVTARTAYQIMPFENEIVVVEITGEKLEDLLTYLERAKTAHPLSGMQILVDHNFKTLQATVNGKKIQRNKTYFVATSDYLQQGGDNMNFFKDPVKVYPVDYKIRNSVIDYFSKVDTLKTGRDNRYLQKQGPH